MERQNNPTDYFEGDYLDTLCINEVLDSRNFGKDHGSMPVRSEAQIKAIDALAAKLISKVAPKASPKKQEDEVEPILTFDLSSTDRVILFDGKISKKSQTSIVQHNSRRHMFLLNDVLLVTSSQNAQGRFMSTTEKFSIHQIIEFNQFFSILDLENTYPSDNNCSFEIGTKERTYQFIAESENDKKIWLEEIEQAAAAILSERKRLVPGWHHELMRGTLASSALLGDMPRLRKRIDELEDQIVDVPDFAGMCPIHWASLRGHYEAVKLLLEAGSNVDILNSGLNTPLLLAASRGYDDIVELLLTHDADFRVRNMKERDAFRMAVLYGHRSRGLYRIIDILQHKGVDLNERDSSGATALHECASRNLSRPVQLIVDAGADVNMKHGRNGLTPLQLACSNAEADAETVRSFLDKGAHPNWRDAGGRTAFEMVLRTHQRVSNGLTANGDVKDCYDELQSGGDPSANKLDNMDALAYFVQHALPSLMEIVKHGGRYTEESIEHLRPSFRDALNSAREFWEKQGQPDTFHEQIAEEGGGAVVGKKGWMADNASPYCLLCLDEFTKYSMRSRRHHCRACGILCCKFCSTKRLEMRPGAPPPPPPGSGSPGTSGKSATSNSGRPLSRRNSDASPVASAESRVCDGCFNKLVFQHNAYYIGMLKARREQEKIRAEDAAKAEQEAANRAALGLPAGGGRSPTGDNGTLSKSVQENMDSTQATMSETMRMMDKRGEDLKHSVILAEEMNNAAGVFNQNARELLESQKRRVGRR